MPFRRRLQAPIQTEKHEVSWTDFGIDASTPGISKTLLTAVVPANANLATECEVGSIVKWIYLEFQFSAETITNTKAIHWLIGKEPFGTTLKNPILYYQTDKRFVVKRGMEMVPKDVNTIIKRIIVVPVPKKMQRMGRDDKWVFVYTATLAETINACGFAITKPMT